jgi:uncharacterized membrane protein required for colicin V production
MYYITLCAIAIIVICGLIGLWRGLFKTFFGLLALVLSLAATYYVSPYVGNYVIENTEIDDYVESKIYDKLEKAVEKKVKESLENAGITKDLDEIAKQETSNLMGTDPDKATQVQMIDGLNVSDIVKTSFLENNNDEIYESLGITGFYRYIARYAAILITKVLSFVMTFVVLRLVLLLIYMIINHLMGEVPALSAVNRFSGFALGLAGGVVVVWILMTIGSFAFGSKYTGILTESIVLQKLDEYNVLLQLLKNKF